jgi:predicted nucleic acid-binding protein
VAVEEGNIMNNCPVFIDTGAFYALIDRDDAHHVVAYKQWSELLKENHLLCITNYIISETYTLLRYRLGWSIACKFLKIIEESSELGRIRIMMVAKETEKYARKILLEFNDKDLSYIDATSMATIKLEQVPLVFSFDSHFQLARARVIP